MAHRVTVVASISCREPCVDQSPSRITATTARRFSGPVMGPSSPRLLATISRPPSSRSTSGLMLARITKQSTTDITAAQGAPAANHCGQEMEEPMDSWMKPTATRF